MLIRNNILSILLISIFIFPLPAIALDIGNRIRKEAGFTKVELSAMEEMGWSDKRLVKYANIACGYIVDGKSNGLQSLYRYPPRELQPIERAIHKRFAAKNS